MEAGGQASPTRVSAAIAPRGIRLIASYAAKFVLFYDETPREKTHE